MPFEARKVMTWGPGRTPDQAVAHGSDEIPTAVLLQGGDEVPVPVKRVLIQNGHVAKVDKVAGKPWASQPKPAQDAWAKCNGKSVLSAKDNHTGETANVVVETHGTRMVNSDKEAPAATKRRVREDYVPPTVVRNHQVEAPGPALSESLEVAGGEVSADESVPPTDVEGTGLLEDPKPPKAKTSKKTKKRGRPRKK